MKLEGLKINFLGDSITAGSGASCKENIYHAVLKRRAGLAEARNYGIGGTRFALQNGIEGFPKNEVFDTNSFSERFSSMSDDADVVVVFGGTNDYGHGDAPIGKPSDRAPDTFWGACHYLFSGLIKKYPEARIIVMTPLHRANESSKRGDSKPYDVAPLYEYVQIIRSVAEYYSLPVLDLFRVSGIQPEIEEIRSRYMPDGLHPSDMGNERIAELLEGFLRAL